MTPLEGPAHFNTTHWTTILTLREDGPAADQALERLCGRYWYPLYAFLRREGKSAHDAEDLVQSFLTSLIESRRLGQLDPARGRFRSYLLSGLKNHMTDALRHDLRQKRNPAGGIVHMEALAAEEKLAAEPASQQTPDRLYEKAWAETLLTTVLGQLREEYVHTGKGSLFEPLALHLVDDASAESYRDIGERLGMNEGAIKVAALRMRKRFGDLLRAELGCTVSSKGEIEDELRHLASLWTG